MVTITEMPSCNKCEAGARWSIAVMETPFTERKVHAIGMVIEPERVPVVRYFACGHHLSQVLRGGQGPFLVSELRVE